MLSWSWQCCFLYTRRPPSLRKEKLATVRTQLDRDRLEAKTERSVAVSKRQMYRPPRKSMSNCFRIPISTSAKCGQQEPQPKHLANLAPRMPFNKPLMNMKLNLNAIS